MDDFSLRRGLEDLLEVASQPGREDALQGRFGEVAAPLGGVLGLVDSKEEAADLSLLAGDVRLISEHVFDAERGLYAVLDAASRSHGVRWARARHADRSPRALPAAEANVAPAVAAAAQARRATRPARPYTTSSSRCCRPWTWSWGPRRRCRTRDSSSTRASAT